MVLLRTQSDERLVALARAGNEAAFEAIVRRYRPLLVRAARRYLSDARAEDAVQQAFLAAWSALQRGDQVRDLRPWLYRIVHNTALNALRAAGPDWAELPDTVPSGESELDRRMDVREALTGLAGLPERQREALLRVAVEGRPQTEVAAELGVSEGAVRQLVHRARLTLRAAATAITPLPLVTWAAGAGGAAAGAGGAAAGAGGAGATAAAAGAGGAAMGGASGAAAAGSAGAGGFVAKVGVGAVLASAAVAVPVVVVRDEPRVPATAEAAGAAPTRTAAPTSTPRGSSPVLTRTATATPRARRRPRAASAPRATSTPRATSPPRAVAPRVEPTARPRRRPTATATPRREPVATSTPRPEPTVAATPTEAPHTYDQPRTDNSGPGSANSGPGSGSSGSGADNSGPGSDSSGSGSDHSGPGSDSSGSGSGSGSSGSGSDNSGPGSGSSGSGSSGSGGHDDDSH